jgi:predicted RNA methylase
MARLSTAAQKRHQKAMALLESGDNLTSAHIEQIYQDYHEGATNLNGMHGAFFTPRALAKDFRLEVSGTRIIDLCAGNGMLSHACTSDEPEQFDVTCVELNPEYVELGKRLVPHATWHCESVLNIAPQEDKFDVAISNPPFGAIAGIGMFDLEVVRVASTVAKRGVFILPQQSTPFRYSGCQAYSERVEDKLKRWMDKTGIAFEMNCGIDCDMYLNDWKGVKPKVEIVLCEFE